MIVTDIKQCVKVTRENNFMGMDMYIEQFDYIKIVDVNGMELEGQFYSLELSPYEDYDDDILYIINSNEEVIDIGVSYIRDITEVDRK